MTSNAIIICCDGDVGFSCVTALCDKGLRPLKVFTASHAIRVFCGKNDICCEEYQPLSLISSLRSKANNILINAWTPHIYPNEVIESCDLTVNLHPSLLPFYKGSHCATWSIINNGPYGVSICEMVSKLDTGRVYAQKELAILDYIPAHMLQRMLKDELIVLFEKSIEKIVDRSLIPYSKIVSSSEAKNPIVATTFTRMMVQEDRIKELHDFDSLNHLVRWLFAHSFEESSAVLRMVDGSMYSVILQKHG